MLSLKYEKPNKQFFYPCLSNYYEIDSSRQDFTYKICHFTKKNINLQQPTFICRSYFTRFRKMYSLNVDIRMK